MILVKNIITKLKDSAPYAFKNFYRKRFKKFYGLKNVDEKMLKYINFNNGYFIEMGAHDGVHNSNTFYFEKNLNWKGILIEPSDYFNILKKNRSEKNKFFNYGCSAFDNEIETILEGNGDFSYCRDITDEDFSRWYETKLIQTKRKIEEKKIQLKTLNSILIQSDAPKIIDFFSLDVEGMEMQVLKGIDFNIFNFKFLLVECSNEKRFVETKNFLTTKKYEHINNLTPWDILFVYKN